MPGRLFLTRGSAFGTDLPPRANIQPGQEIMVWDGRALRPMRWGIIPVGRVNARGRPVMETIINARSETVFGKSAFAGVQRGIVPADGWYEWTGKARRKVPWRLRRADGAQIGFAAIFDVWRAPNGTEVLQVATVTCEPNHEVAKIHHRMGVILEPWAHEGWLQGAVPQARALCESPPRDSILIEAASNVNWEGA